MCVWEGVYSCVRMCVWEGVYNCVCVFKDHLLITRARAKVLKRSERRLIALFLYPLHTHRHSMCVSVCVCVCLSVCVCLCVRRVVAQDFPSLSVPRLYV